MHKKGGLIGDMKTKVLYYAAAAATAIAGILHLTLAPNMLNFNSNGATLFFVGGAAQVFWALPMVRRWGRVWCGIGIGGTAVLMAIWIITRFPGNPITGNGGRVNEKAMAIEVTQGAFIADSRDTRNRIADEKTGQKDRIKLGLKPLFYLVLIIFVLYSKGIVQVATKVAQRSFEQQRCPQVLCKVRHGDYAD